SQRLVIVGVVTGGLTDLSVKDVGATDFEGLPELELGAASDYAKVLVSLDPVVEPPAEDDAAQVGGQPLSGELERVLHANAGVGEVVRRDGEGNVALIVATVVTIRRRSGTAGCY